jgi:hypothetical protein
LIAVGSRFRSFDLAAAMMPQMEEMRQRMEQMTGKPIAPIHEKLSILLAPADKLCPLKNGDELLVTLPDAEVNDKQKFFFDVALNEPQIVQAEPLIETIHQLAGLVDSIVAQFAAYL